MGLRIAPAAALSMFMVHSHLVGPAFRHAGTARCSSIKVSARLREFDGGDRPLPMVACDSNSQTMHFVQPNALHGPGLSVGEDHGLADKLSLGVLEFAEDR
jgi:hypothetical protein